MHELGIAMDICRAVCEMAHGRPVTSITIDVGILAGVAVDALDFCIHEVARDAELGEPEIRINSIAPTMHCSCGADYTPEDILDACPSCGGYDRRIESGMDVVVSEVEVQGDAE